MSGGLVKECTHTRSCSTKNTHPHARTQPAGDFDGNQQKTTATNLLHVLVCVSVCARSVSAMLVDWGATTTTTRELVRARQTIELAPAVSWSLWPRRGFVCVFGNNCAVARARGYLVKIKPPKLCAHIIGGIRARVHVRASACVSAVIKADFHVFIWWCMGVHDLHCSQA